MILVGIVLFLAILAPNFSFRTGALICGCVILLSVPSGYRFQLSDVLIVTYAVLAGLSLLWTKSIELTHNSFMNATACAAVFIAVRVAVGRKRDYLFLAWAMIAGSLVSVAIMVLSAGELGWVYEAAGRRIGLDGINLNYTAYALATTTVLILSLLLTTGVRSSRMRHLGVLTLLLCMYVGIVLTGTRGALVSFGIVCAWWLFARINLRLAYGVLITSFVVANLAMVFGWIDIVLSKLKFDSSRDTGDLNGRITIWPTAREAVAESPLIGHGVGSFPSNQSNFWGIHAHSAVLDIGTGLGVLGLLLFFGALWHALNFGIINHPYFKYLVGGAFIAVSMPILLSGFWTESPVFWGGAGLISRSYFLLDSDCGDKVS